MTVRRLAWLSAMMMCAASSTIRPLAGQTASSQSTAANTIPRTKDGRPDFQGMWSFATLTPLERPRELSGKPFLSDAEAAEFIERQLAVANADNRAVGDYNEFWWERPRTVVRLNGRNLTSRIIEPPDGRIPLLTRSAQERVAAIQQMRREHPADGPEDRPMPERCLIPTPVIEPHGGGNGNFVQIVQTTQHVTMFTEDRLLRIIAVGRGEHLPGSIRLTLGDSLAWWEGDTLVVDTTNYVGKFEFTFAPADDNLHLIERLKLVDANTLLNETTVHDATAFTKPWTFVLTMARTDARMFEYACHEGNYALEGILRGARAEERSGSDGSK